MQTTIQKKRFIKKYTLKDIRDFLESEGFEWCGMQVKNTKTGKCSNGEIKMFNGEPVYMYLSYKGATNPSFHYVTVANDKFVIKGQGYSVNLSEYWKPFYIDNHEKQDLLK